LRGIEMTSKTWREMAIDIMERAVETLREGHYSHAVWMLAEAIQRVICAEREEKAGQP